MRIPWVIGFCALVALLAGQSRAAEPGPLILSAGETSRPFRAVGRLEISGHGFCTAAVISPRIVLTAAHCVTLSNGRIRDPRGIRFDAGYDHGDAIARRQAIRVLVPEGFQPSLALTGIARDVALIELRRPVDPARIEPLPVGRSAGRRVQVISYGQDRALKAESEGCRLLGRRQRTMLLDCSAEFGSSGAPVLSLSGGVVRIVGVISAKAKAAGRLVTLATELDAALPGLLSRVSDTSVPSASR